MFDETDRKILFELSKNSRRSFRQISRKVGVSVATVISRVARMEKEGIIKNYTINVDAEKLGYDLTAVIEVNISKGSMLEVEKALASKSNVIGVYNITGLTDIIVIARFRNRRELDNFVKSVLNNELIERTNTRVVLNTVKEGLGIPAI